MRRGEVGGTDVARRLDEVRARIVSAARDSGRDPSTMRLVVVTKEISPDRIRDAIDAGATDLGENRAQELVAKMEALAGSPVKRWHFIGTLQRNKVKLVAGRVALIHSVDSAELGRAISGRAASEGVVQDVLVEVNVSGEPSKHGVDPGAAWSLVASLAGLPGIRLKGLMTIAPPGSGVASRAAFAGLRELREQLRGELGGGALDELSMGMTSDFEVAVEEGATIVRVGTAIFGPRR
jgi:pyridoxal phosphate enzyme (YggS family)